jgi:Holliday junction resolvasome RuvABC endonuclease subunit
VIIVGIDPGIADLGIAVITSEGGKRSAYETTRLHTEPDKGDRERVEWLASNVLWVIRHYGPDAIGVESYGWQGASRSANPNAFRMSWAVGYIMGALPRDIIAHEVSRRDALRAVGCRTEQGASRLMRTMHPSAAKASQHELDALMVAHCVAARVGAPKLRRMGL